jgi:branched-chain amino acid transport system substrate-binding protein
MAGRRVEFLPEDEEASPSVALTKAKKLVELNKVHFLAGPLLASSGYAVAPYAESKKVPDVTFCAADDLTQRKRGKYLFRAAWSSSQPSHIMGEYAYKVLGYRKVATIALDYAFGWETVSGFQRAFEELGGRVIQKIWVPMNITDFGPYMPQIQKDAEAIHAMMTGKSSVLFLKQFQEYGLKDKLPVNGVGHLTDESILPATGDAALGVITALPYSPMIQTPVNREFVKTYVEKYGKTPSLFSVMAYTGISMIDQAVNSLKGDVSNPERVARALRMVHLQENPRGPIKFDEYGNSTQNVYIRKVEKVGGELQNTVIYTYPEVSQFWKYKPEEFLKQPVYSRDYPPLKP